MGRYRTRTAFRDTPLLAALRVLQLSGGWRPPLPPQGGLQGWGREARSLIEPWPLQYKAGELFPPHLLHLPRPRPCHHLIPTDTQAGRKGRLPCTATVGQAWSTQQIPEPGFKPRSPWLQSTMGKQRRGQAWMRGQAWTLVPGGLDDVMTLCSIQLRSPVQGPLSLGSLVSPGSLLWTPSWRGTWSSHAPSPSLPLKGLS